MKDKKKGSAIKSAIKELRKSLNTQITSGIEAVVTGLDYNPKDAKKEINKAAAKLAKKLSKKLKVSSSDLIEASAVTKKAEAPVKEATASSKAKKVAVAKEPVKK